MTPKVTLPDWVRVESGLEGRINRKGEALELIQGFLPFQVEGIHLAASQELGAYLRWSTGTGKTVGAIGLIQWLFSQDDPYDLCFYVVKPNNLTDTQKKIFRHSGMESVVIKGTPARRDRLYAEADYAVEQGKQPILVFNAEKFREDKDVMKFLVEGRSVLVIFDEMSEKYSNRATALYRATAEVLYTSFKTSAHGSSRGKKIFYPRDGYQRPARLFCLATSATPIIRDPEGYFNQFRMIVPGALGNINDFNNTHVAFRDRFGNVAGWKNLDVLRDKVRDYVHNADKELDPAIGDQFPEKMPPETIYCDLDPATQKLYNTLQKEYSNIGLASILGYHEILAAINCLQMICSNPRSVLLSAEIRQEYESKLAEFRAEGHTAKEIKEFEKKFKAGSLVALKLVQLVNDDSLFTDEKNGECILSKMIELRKQLEDHQGKAIVFTAQSDMLQPFISEWFDRWGITHVRFHGGLSARSKDEAKEKFRTDPDIKVFLSTDAGKDSIDLPEASLTIHYEPPQNQSHAGVLQRDNRQDRIDSAQEILRRITLTSPFTVEERKEIIIERKKFYHDFFGAEEVAEAEADTTSRQDALFILTGQTSDDD